MPKPLTIIFDIDAILGNLHDIWYELYNKQYNDNLTVDNVTEWDTSKFAKYGKKVFDFLKLPEVHLDAKPIEGAQDALEALSSDGHDLLICSSAMSTDDTPGYKIRWLAKNYPMIKRDNIFIGERKEILRADVFIDDSPKQIAKYRKRNPEASILTISYPYNQCAVGDVNLMAQDYKDTKGAWKVIQQAVQMKAAGSQLWG